MKAADMTPEAAINGGAQQGGGVFSFAIAKADEQGATPNQVFVQPTTKDGGNNNNTGGGPHALRWVPSLSPLISDGDNLTPGAAAGLIGLTPPTAGAAAVADTVPGVANNVAAAQQEQAANNNTSVDLRARPPPLALPPRQLSQQTLNPDQSNTNRTMESNPNSFRIHRRDLISPDRKNSGGGGGFEFMGSASESEPYSFSHDCDTGSASELDFPDTIPAAVGGAHVDGVNGTNNYGISGGINSFPLTNARRLSGMSLAWEMHTSPDWQSRRPPSRSSTPPVQYNNGLGGDGCGLGRGRMLSPGQDIDVDGDGLDHPSNPSSAPQSVESSPSGSCPVSSRSCAAPGAGSGGAPSALLRFPTLDGLNLNIQDVGPLSARDRISAKNTPRYSSPFESSAFVAAAAANTTHASARAAPSPPKKALGGSAAAVVPPLVLPFIANNPLRRKRQHSSRRPLVHALKENGNGCDNSSMPSARSVDLCSSRSLQELMPVRKGARRGGTFHADGIPVDGSIDNGNGVITVGIAGDEAQPISGHSTQRSARGPPSARLADKNLSATAAVSEVIGSVPCTSATADRIHTMTLNDTNKK
jgi:hypothetical protein